MSLVSASRQRGLPAQSSPLVHYHSCALQLGRPIHHYEYEVSTWEQVPPDTAQILINSIIHERIQYITRPRQSAQGRRNARGADETPGFNNSRCIPHHRVINKGQTLTRDRCLDHLHVGKIYNGLREKKKRLMSVTKEMRRFYESDSANSQFLLLPVTLAR
jgi:hypothetical protein